MMLVPDNVINQNWTAISGETIISLTASVSASVYNNCLAVIVRKKDKQGMTACLKTKFINSDSKYVYEYIKPITFKGLSYYVLLPNDFTNVSLNDSSYEYYILA
jgi:hypothetical protein